MDMMRGLFKMRDSFLPCALTLWQKLWWRYMPGVVFTVRWPRGQIIVDHHDPRWRDMGGAVWVNLGESSDPNDFYRHELESLIGKQGWDWDWGMDLSDPSKDMLTIKIRQKYAKYAIMLALKWS